MPYSSKRFTSASTFLLALGSLFACVACSPPVSLVDSGSEASAGDGGDARPSDVPTDVGHECMTDNDCTNGLFCDGEERCLSGYCQHGSAPCDDHASCTMDMCDENVSMHCSHVADNTMCGDGNACNGIELCAPGTPGSMSGTGCQPVHPDGFIDCDDSNNCTIDICDPGFGCVHAPRDLDGDGVVDRACPDGLTGMQGTDCNDGDPSVYPGAPELCDDGRDNNCNGLVDYLDTMAGCRPMNDSCMGARALAGPGRYYGTTAMLRDSFTLSCNTTTARDSIFTFTLMEPHDVRIGMSDTTTGAAIAVADSCAMGPVMDRACSRAVSTGPFGENAAPSLFLRALPAGTYYLFVETPSTTPFTFTIAYEDPTTPPAGDSCPPTSPAVDLTSGVPQTLDTTVLTDDFSVMCNTGLPVADAVFRLHLDALSNVTLDVTGPAGGTNYVSVRQAPCPGAQLRCLSGTTVSGSFRDLAPGDYFVIVENSTAGRVTATATITPGGMRATGDACSSAATIPLGTTFPYSGNATVDFSTLLAGADHGTSCGSMSTPDGWRDAVYSFTLAADADTTVSVTPTGTWSPNYRWALETTCGSQSTTRGRCQSGVGTSTTNAVFFGLPAGTYYVVVETNTTPPAGAGFRVNINAIDPSMRPQFEACPGANVALSASGTNLTGMLMVDASSPMLDRNAQHGTSCGSATAPTGWTDMVFNFTIPDRRTVTMNFASVSPPYFWYLQAQTTCGVQSSGVPISVSGGATATCASMPGGGIPTGAGTSVNLGSLAAGTYYLVMENTAAMQGQTRVSITAAP